MSLFFQNLGIKGNRFFTDYNTLAETLKEVASSGTTEDSAILSDAVGGIISVCDLSRETYAFSLFSQEGVIYRTENGYDFLDSAVGKNVDISVIAKIDDSLVYGYAHDMYKKSGGIILSDTTDYAEDVLNHIYGKKVNKEEEDTGKYQMILATGLRTVELKAPITEEYAQLAKLDEIDETQTDTDEDGLPDYKEINFSVKGADGKLLIKFVNGVVDLPTYGECVAVKSELTYVERGLNRFNDVVINDIAFLSYVYGSVHVLPIVSDPTSEDGDGDGIFDVNEKWNGIDERYKNILALKSDTIESLYPELRKNDENKPFYISVNKNDIYFNIKINNNDRIEQIRDAISSYWDGKYFGDIYDFYPGMKINVKTRITQTENSNSIEVVFEQSTKRSVTSMNKIIIYSSSLETNEDTKATIAHEFGHIFGLADAYLESGVFNYSCIEFVNSITGSIKTAQRPYGLLPYNFSDESCEIDVFTEIMSICNTKSVVCSNDIEMILNNNAGIHYAKFTPHFYVSKISNAIKTPYLLLYNKDCEMFSYNTKENKITKIDFLDINMTNVDKYLYSYGKKYNTFLATYKDWIDRTYPQYSTETKQIHQKLEMSFNFQSLYSESKSNFRNVSINKDSKTLYLCGMYPNAKEAANDLLDGSGNSIWVLDDESFNDLVDEIIKKSDLDVTYSVSKSDSTILPDNSIWDCAEENVPPHYHILENGFPVNISSKIFVGHEGGFHYEDYYN